MAKRTSIGTDQDYLGAYPERMQVSALPERRFLKTSRFLAVITIINIAVLLMLGTLYVYMTSHVDVSIGTRRAAHLYTIDYEKKKLIPMGYYKTGVSTLYLVSESDLRRYINQRHTILWDNAAMASRWNTAGWLSSATSDKVWREVELQLTQSLNESRARGFVRDVHIMDLQNVYGNLWEGIIDTYDMPIPDSFNPICQCSDNTKECLMCKNINHLGHRRYKIYARTALGGRHTIQNPYGFQVTAYYMLYMPVDPADPFWDLPRELRPNL